MLKNAGRSDQTIAHYCTAIKSFTKWCKRDRRTDGDLLEDLGRPAVVTERKRSALTPEQLGRLISTTRASKTRRSMPGADRAWLYHLATVTGLRRSELQSLTPGSFDLDSAPPTVFVDGRHTKNGESATQPLPEHIIPELRTWLTSKPRSQPLFPHDRNSSVMIKADLRLAGIPSEQFCFHSLRHTYASLIDGCGASTKEAMTLARHADPNLTLNRYTHTQLQNLGRVVNGLPNLLAHDQSLAHILPTSRVSGGLNGTSATLCSQGPGETREDHEYCNGQHGRQDSNPRDSGFGDRPRPQSLRSCMPARANRP